MITLPEGLALVLGGCAGVLAFSSDEVVSIGSEPASDLVSPGSSSCFVINYMINIIL